MLKTKRTICLLMSSLLLLCCCLTAFAGDANSLDARMDLVTGISDDTYGNIYFNFVNSSGYFGGDDYTLTSEIYDAYLSTASSPLESFYLTAIMGKSWAGSCYGMTCVYALSQAGRIDPSFFDGDAVTLADLSCPSDDAVVRDLINYYQLRLWSFSSLQKIVPKIIPNLLNQQKARERLVEDLNTSEYPVALSMWFDTTVIHTIAAQDIRETDNGYEITIVDPNSNYFNTLYISSDFSEMHFDRTYEDVTILMSQTVDEGVFDMYNVQTVLQGLGYTGL